MRPLQKLGLLGKGCSAASSKSEIDHYLLTDQALQKTGAVINVPDCCQKRRKYEDCKADHMDCCVFRGVDGF